MDEEIERVARAISDDAAYGDWDKYPPAWRNTWRKYASAAIAAMSKPAVAATTWIKCSERMPEEGSLVLTCDEDDESSLLVRYYDGSEVDPSPWQPGPRGEWEAYREAITHWMPLPEPPKGTR